MNADAADAFYAFLFGGSGAKNSDLKAKAAAREPLPSFTLEGVKLTFNFPKMARIAELVYETAKRVANLDHAPARDHKGPRAGRRGRGR